MRGADDLVELEERRVGARLARIHVEAGAGDPALLEGGGEGGLVDDAAAGGVDDADAGLDLVQRVVADQAERLGRLGEMDGDEVRGLQQLVQGEQLHAHLRGAGGLHERVVGDDLHAEGRHPLRDQHADAAETDDAERLLAELDAGVLAALPLAVLQRGVGLRDVPGGGDQQAARQLGGGDDVGGGSVDHHDAGLGGGRDVDVVEPDARAGDDLELPGGGDASASTFVAERTSTASTSAMAPRSSPRSAPLHWRISKSGPRASTVAGESSSAISTTGLLTWSPVWRIILAAGRRQEQRPSPDGRRRWRGSSPRAQGRRTTL